MNEKLLEKLLVDLNLKIDGNRKIALYLILKGILPMGASEFISKLQQVTSLNSSHAGRLISELKNSGVIILVDQGNKKTLLPTAKLYAFLVKEKGKEYANPLIEKIEKEYKNLEPELKKLKKSAKASKDELSKKTKKLLDEVTNKAADGADVVGNFLLSLRDKLNKK